MKNILGRAAFLVAVVCLGSTARGDLVIPLTGITSGTAGSNPVAIPLTATVDGVTFNYNLDITLGWVDSVGTPVVGPAGIVSTGPNSGPSPNNYRLGADTTTSGDDEIDFDTFLMGGNQVFETVTFGISGLPGTVTFDAFSLLTPTDSPTILGTGTTTITALPTSFGDDFRVVSVTADFTAVPEPSQWAMMGLIGLALSGRSLQRRFFA